ncbi:MAG TPA: aminotransferase class I/II-fold pyridoxal phosphate-dependent enzyme [Acidimicrobiales bacterium]|nr:aminotransferase class I/II-fold pyridoxal phosphate-dependent enzyme [Acidimicrobiales bacterium]
MTGPGDEVVIPGAGAHGGDGARVAAALGLPVDEVLDLSASLNPFAPDVAVLAARHLGALRRYPDVEAAERLVAQMVGVAPERLVLTAGGAQAIALVADHLGTGWVDEPDFSLYRRHLARLDPSAPVWRSDPHNPSGALAAGDAGAGRAVGVWDEAFLPLSAGVWTRGRAGWALGSLTKAFACPGLRLGYAVAPSEADAAALRERRPAWAVGGLACAVLPELVAESDPPGWTAQIAVARKATAEVLVVHGLAPLPSDAPWLVVPGAAGLRDALARRAVVVRDCTSFGLPGHVRIAVPDERGLARLARALTQAQSSMSDPTE